MNTNLNMQTVPVSRLPRRAPVCRGKGESNPYRRDLGDRAPLSREFPTNTGVGYHATQKQKAAPGGRPRKRKAALRLH